MLRMKNAYAVCVLFVIRGIRMLFVDSDYMYEISSPTIHRS